MRQTFSILLGSALCMLGTPVLFAQADAADTGSWFSMFLWSDDFLGLLIIWLLLAMSAFSIGFSIHLMTQYRRTRMLPEGTKKKVNMLLMQRQFRQAIDYANKDKSYLGHIISATLHEAPNGFMAMERAIEESADNETVKILRPIEYLNVLGNIAPMIGLFGTVYGMIRAFQQLVAEGGNAEPSQLAAGISTALITTFWGLVVAVPALASYALIRNKIDSLASEGVLIVESIIAPFKPTPQQIQAARQAAAQANTPQTVQRPTPVASQPSAVAPQAAAASSVVVAEDEPEVAAEIEPEQNTAKSNPNNGDADLFGNTTKK
ncbi:MotA/TolQ/ExbB proton channel family protein [Poriferisphaera sp. WC338]|uniref:MotA/TolQ/ExbB proton channel family protein n=1 Tax=Poriferisphaera sp. WC338 TaxID=3425129 RepID=UPI003D813275